MRHCYIESSTICWPLGHRWTVCAAVQLTYHQSNGLSALDKTRHRPDATWQPARACERPTGGRYIDQ